MKAIFVHDHKFKHGNGQIYSNAFHSGLWSRYLQHFDSITVVGRDGGEKGAGKEIDASSQGVSIQLWPSLSPTRPFRRFKIRRKLATLIAQHDAVVARLPSEYGLMAASLARQLGKPCLIEVVGCARDAFSHHGSAAAWLYAPFAAYRVKHAVERAGFVLYVSKNFLQRRYPPDAGAVSVSASNVELPQMSSEVLTQRLHKIAITSDKLKLGLIGSLSTKYKGVHTAIEALAKVEAQRELELHILGPGETNALQALADQSGVGDKVFFHPPLPAGQAVFEWLDDIDIYLQPSLTEGMPRSLIEAMSRGCPALATSVGGIPELLPTDCLVEPEDAKGLSTLIGTLVADKPKMRCEAERNFEKAQEFDGALMKSKRNVVVQALAEVAARNATS